MLNIGGWEVLIIFLVALLVLGPDRLPDAAKQAGRVFREFRRISSGFQRELNDAMRDPIKAAGLDVTLDAEVERALKDPFAEKKSTVNPSAIKPAATAEPANEPKPMSGDSDGGLQEDPGLTSDQSATTDESLPDPPDHPPNLPDPPIESDR